MAKYVVAKSKLKSRNTVQLCKNSDYSHIIAGWRKVGGNDYYFRSKSEANYGRYLEWQKKRGEILDWQHEPHTFWFEKIQRGVRSYLPDFKVLNLDGSHCWIEVKGYFDPKSLTKIKRFRKYYPKENLILVDKKFFQKNNNALAILIKEWE